MMEYSLLSITKVAFIKILLFASCLGAGCVFLLSIWWSELALNSPSHSTSSSDAATDSILAKFNRPDPYTAYLLLSKNAANSSVLNCRLNMPKSFQGVQLIQSYTSGDQLLFEATTPCDLGWNNQELRLGLTQLRLDNGDFQQTFHFLSQSIQRTVSSKDLWCNSTDETVAKHVSGNMQIDEDKWHILVSIPVHDPGKLTLNFSRLLAKNDAVHEPSEQRTMIYKYSLGITHN